MSGTPGASRAAFLVVIAACIDVGTTTPCGDLTQR
jgi:hypothetical protein